MLKFRLYQYMRVLRFAKCSKHIERKAYRERAHRMPGPRFICVHTPFNVHIMHRSSGKNAWINDFIHDTSNPDLVATQLLTRDRAKAARKAL